MQTIDIIKLKELATKHPEIKKLCLLKHAPVYLLQMELERYQCQLSKAEVKNLRTIKF